MRDDSPVDRRTRGPCEGRVYATVVPPSARALSTLRRIDYADTFLVGASPARRWTAQEWVRAVLLDAPLAARTKLLSGWSAIGLKVGKGGGGQSLLGWEVRHDSPEFVLLGADSWIGMPGELLFKREPDALLFATFVQHDNAIARAVWAAVEPVHVRVVRDILSQATARVFAASRSRGLAGDERSEA